MIQERDLTIENNVHFLAQLYQLLIESVDGGGIVHLGRPFMLVQVDGLEKIS